MKFCTKARHGVGFAVNCRFEGKRRRICMNVGQIWSVRFRVAGLPRLAFVRYDRGMSDVKDRIRRGVYVTE